MDQAVCLGSLFSFIPFPRSMLYRKKNSNVIAKHLFIRRNENQGVNKVNGPCFIIALHNFHSFEDLCHGFKRSRSKFVGDQKGYGLINVLLNRFKIHHQTNSKTIAHENYITTMSGSFLSSRVYVIITLIKHQPVNFPVQPAR